MACLPIQFHFQEQQDLPVRPSPRQGGADGGSLSKGVVVSIKLIKLGVNWLHLHGGRARMRQIINCFVFKVCLIMFHKSVLRDFFTLMCLHPLAKVFTNLMPCIMAQCLLFREPWINFLYVLQELLGKSCLHRDIFLTNNLFQIP